MKLMLSYRKGLNMGYTPVWYHTNRGVYPCWIIKEGRKWMIIQWVTEAKEGRKRKRVPLSEKRYMREFKGRAG